MLLYFKLPSQPRFQDQRGVAVRLRAAASHPVCPQPSTREGKAPTMCFENFEKRFLEVLVQRCPGVRK